MRSREIQQFLAAASGRTVGEVDQRTRPLRNMSENFTASGGGIKSGPRGPSAPHMTIAEGAMHVLIMVSRRVGDAGDVAVRLLEECRMVQHPEYVNLSEAFLAPARVFGFWVIIAMAKGLESGGFDITSLEMWEDGSFAKVNFNRRSLKNVFFLFSANSHHVNLDADGAKRLYESVEKNAAGNRFVIGRAQLEILGSRILMDSPFETDENSASRPAIMRPTDAE